MLSTELLLAFSLFALAASITPGPNNTLLLASGATFGFRRTLPHMLGVASGFFLTVLSIGLGLGAVFRSFPGLYAWLRYLGTAYLLYLAWKMIRSAPLQQGGQGGQGGQGAAPLGFLDAAAFQWINPKSWTMALAALSAYTPTDNHLIHVVVLSAVWTLIVLPCVAFWTGCGTLIRRVLDDPTRRRRFNWAMALLLAVSVYMMWR